MKEHSARKFLKPLIILAVIALIAVGGYSIYKQNNPGQGLSPAQAQVKSQVITLNKTFDLPTGLEGGKDNIQPLKFTFVSAQLTNRIVVAKKYQYAKSGATYLMLSVLIENSNTKSLNIRTRDLVRLIDNNGKKFAPSFYNKDLPVQADAVKKDIVGFLVPDSIKDFKIQYGSPTGAKQVIDLKFNK